MTQKVATLLAERGAKADQLTALATNAKGALVGDELASFNTLKADIESIDAQVIQIKDAEAISAKSAIPVAGQRAASVPATPKTEDDKVVRSRVVGGLIKMIGATKGNYTASLETSKNLYGESHPVTDAIGKALSTSGGTTGGFLVPQDYVADVIELLRPATVVRKSGPRILPMPRGTLAVPKQTSGANATYGAEGAPIATSQQGFGNVIASFKKLTSLVPVSNDMMRFAEPATDEIVRDDLVQQMARGEDKSFLRSDGTVDSPMGIRYFAPAANLVASNASYSLATVTGELGSASLRLKNANVGMVRPVWWMAPRVEEYLMTVQNSNGFYVFRDEMLQGKLRKFPYFTTTAIPTNLTIGGATGNGSEIYLTDMDSVLICDSMQLRLDVSTDGSYVDSGGVQRNAFQLDQTLIRAIAEHDLQMRHDEAAAVITGVCWTPTGS